MFKFEKVSWADKNIRLPERGTKRSAGYDFFAPYDFVVPAHGHSKLVPLDIKAYMPENYFLGITIRSSLAINHSLSIVQGMAIIDSDYVDNWKNEGNIGVMLKNDSDYDKTIYAGEHFCQGIFMPYCVTDDDACDTERVGGYGSTGK